MSMLVLWPWLQAVSVVWISTQWEQTAYLQLAVHNFTVRLSQMKSSSQLFWWKICRKNIPTSCKSGGQNVHPLFLVRCERALLAIHHCQVPHFSIPSSRDLCGRSTATLKAPYPCSWMASLYPWTRVLYSPSLLPLTVNQENCQKYLLWCASFLSLPRLLKITYFHLDTQFPLCTSFLWWILSSYLLLSFP